MILLTSKPFDEFNDILTLSGPAGELATKFTDFGMVAPSFSRA